MKSKHADNSSDDLEVEVAQLREQIADLETKNQTLREAPFVPQSTQGAGANAADAAPQGVDTERKNSNPDLVQTTRTGNVRVTHDPSDTFVEEQAAAAGEPVPGRNTS